MEWIPESGTINSNAIDACSFRAIYEERKQMTFPPLKAEHYITQRSLRAAFVSAVFRTQSYEIVQTNVLGKKKKKKRKKKESKIAYRNGY